MTGVSGEDPSAVTQDDQDAGSSRAVSSEYKLVRRETSTGTARTGERVPTTSTVASGKVGDIKRQKNVIRIV